MCCGEHNWPDSIPNFNGVLTLEMTLERFEGRNTVTQLVKGVVTTLGLKNLAVVNTSLKASRFATEGQAVSSSFCPVPTEDRG
jgi:hypothetical protein